MILFFILYIINKVLFFFFESIKKINRYNKSILKYYNCNFNMMINKKWKNIVLDIVEYVGF